ncbi:hypothetical protein P154DRAFT_394789, partial [Amniculicola lignicola CBS 123094]
MAKEKKFNPVAEARKADKQKDIKKNKANVQAQRNERLGRRNPHRLEREIEELKESGDLRPHDRQRLQQLERDLAAINKARDALGDKAPQFKQERRDDGGGGRGGRGGSVLGKRGRDGSWKGRDEDESSDTDADVADIPMPRDTPPPIPPPRHRRGQTPPPPPEPKKSQIVYESAPVMRDFIKEATQFVPASVLEKMKQAKGKGKLLEPEEFDKLEQQGYIGKKEKKTEKEVVDRDLEDFLRQETINTDQAAARAVEAAVQEADYNMMADEARSSFKRPNVEAAIAERNLHHVEIEEVEDED